MEHTYTYMYCTVLLKDLEDKKIPRVTDEGWNSQKQLSGPVEKKKRILTVSSSKAIYVGLSLV